MWKLIRTFLRAEVMKWVKEQFTQAKIEKLVEKLLKRKLASKTMVRKVAPTTRRLILEKVTVDANGKPQISAQGSQEVLKGSLDAVVEQVQ